MSKCKKCFSLDEKTVSTISRISAQLGSPESVVVNKIMDRALSQCSELTSAERYHFQRNSINLALDNTLLLFGICGIDMGLTEKYKVALYMTHGNRKAKNREYRNGIIETSLFEILEQIKELDINIWKNLTSIMAHFGEIRSRYFYLYPICDKKGITPKNMNNVTIHNSNSNVTTNNKKESVTELNEVEKAMNEDIPDDQYLAKKRQQKDSGMKRFSHGH